MLGVFVDIVLPIGAITSTVLLSFANEFSFNLNRLYLSFRLRQASAGFVLALAILFYVIWYLSISPARRLYVLTLLAVSSATVLIEAIYVLTFPTELK
jgi:hypothetical protein